MISFEFNATDSQINKGNVIVTVSSNTVGELQRKHLGGLQMSKQEWETMSAYILQSHPIYITIKDFTRKDQGNE